MSQEQHPPRLRNLTIAGLSSLTGCAAILIVLAALFLGLMIDNILGYRGPATACLLILSVPLSLYIMIKIAFTLIQRIQFTQNTQGQTYEKEE